MSASRVPRAASPAADSSVVRSVTSRSARSQTLCATVNHFSTNFFWVDPGTAWTTERRGEGGRQWIAGAREIARSGRRPALLMLVSDVKLDHSYPRSASTLRAMANVSTYSVHLFEAFGDAGRVPPDGSFQTSFFAPMGGSSRGVALCLFDKARDETTHTSPLLRPPIRSGVARIPPTTYRRRRRTHPC